MDTHHSQPRFKRALTAIDRQIYDMLAERRKEDNKEEDLLAMLLATRYEDTGEGMTDEQLHNEISAMLFAGHETTSNALTWTFYLLAQHPQVEAQLHAELDAVLAGRTPTIMDLPNLPYTHSVLEESMRLYPPAWTLMGRTALEEDEIGGYRIPSGSSLMIFPYVTHRDPRFWQRPDEFYPDHFAPEQVQERPRFAYMPFGGGPRQCIGHDFAMTEAQIVLATVAQRFKLRLAPGFQVEPKVEFTLKPRDGLKMMFEAR